MAAIPLYLDRGGHRDDGLRAGDEVQTAGLGRDAFFCGGGCGCISSRSVFAVTDGVCDGRGIFGSGISIENGT